MTATIRADQLWTFKPDHPGVRVPLAQLADSSEHIHGNLRIEVAGRLLPALGYFGPDDVCLNTWLEELRAIARTLGSSEHASYTFDEGEQGQPAYEFRRASDRLYVSVKESPISGASGEPTFQDVECLWFDFESEVHELTRSLRIQVEVAAGAVGRLWWLAREQSAA